MKRSEYPEDILLTDMWDYYPTETQDDQSYFSDDYNPESEEEQPQEDIEEEDEEDE